MSQARPTSVTVYSAADVPRDALAGETVAVLGYGDLGRTAALNLRDSGVKVSDRKPRGGVRGPREPKALRWCHWRRPVPTSGSWRFPTR